MVTQTNTIMAHNLNERNGKVSFMSVKEKAWHGLGQILAEPATAEQAIKESGLDFTVEKQPVYVPVRKLNREDATGKDNILCSRGDAGTTYGELVQVKGKFATYRSDDGTPFGVVGNGYEIVQNRDAFSFFDAIVGDGEAIYETAGALGDGETIFITAKLPSYIRVGNGDDVVEKYLLLTSSHDGSGAIKAMFTPIRVVCNNTLNAALNSNAARVTIRHTKSAHENLKKAHKVLGIANALSAELEVIFNDMAKVRITDKQLREYIETVVLGNTVERMLKADDQFDLSTRSGNIINAIENYAFNHETQQLETTKGTAFGAYQAITGYYQNVKSYGSNEDKMETILLGNSYQKMQGALVLATQF
jgi:phage/plasmid-like protein (TIGR03299 family)